MKAWIGAMLLVAALLTALGCSKSEMPAAEGKAAPDFTLNDLSGRPVTLSSLQGKVVLLNFWATWCPPCREEIPSMVELNRIMQGKPFQMVAVSIDEGGAAAVTSFLTNAGVTLPVLMDGDGKVAKRYGTTGVPETFVINKKGVILKKIIGPRDWSAPDVVAALDELARSK